METLSAHSAKAAIMILAGKHFTSIFNKTDAVQELVVSTNVKDRQFVASFAVNQILDHAKKNPRMMYFQSLALALTISEEHQLNIGTATRLVRESATHGFTGRFPELPFRLLSRQMNAEEVALLISHYTRDTATRSSNTEAKLKELAKMFCPPAVAKEHVKQLDAFAYRFENEISI